MATTSISESRASGRLRTVIAIALGRLAVWVSRTMLGRSGGVIGGRVLVALDSDAAARLARGHRVVLVSGTNGKSTSTALLVAALAAQRQPATNADGANTPAGLSWTVANASEPDIVLEVDEAWLPWAVRTFGPAAVVLLNLSRDQLHRNPEVARLAQAWRDAMPSVPLVVANADDPWVAWAAETGQRRTWVGAGQVWDEDSLICPFCGDFLDRGDGWSCASCGHTRPAPEWSLRDGAIVAPSGGTVDYATLPGANLANAAMALAAAVELGIPPGAAAGSMARVTDVAGRYGTRRVGNHDVRLMLAKNPASWRASMAMIGEGEAAVLLAFNADGADGRDPSWLYDVDFTALRGRPVAVYGARATDLAVRLALEKVAIIGQYADVRSALRQLPPGRVDLLATYTAFQQARRELSRVA
ncbi:MAG TPA: MurT ligase domain-containing protein [Marmoricola sp.]|nr:MurT ligase domain-containing protein [Marmoricola sp.]